jgi:hypothetical protein
MLGFSGKRVLPRENAATQSGGNSPQESCARNEAVSPQGMSPIESWSAQDSDTESDDGAGSRNWSSRAGSNPLTTSVVSPEKTTSVGVSMLS